MLSRFIKPITSYRKITRDGMSESMFFLQNTFFLFISVVNVTVFKPSISNFTPNLV